MEDYLKKIKLLNNLTLQPEDKIIKAMQRLNTEGPKFQLIVNYEGKLLGTVTDGDIRRAIMKEFTADSSVVDCMHKNPTIGRVTSPKRHRKLFNSSTSLLKFLPVVDSNDIIKYVFVSDYKHNNKSALIMAGGFGKRLGKKTKNIPKPLLKIGNKPILESILQKLEKANFQNIYISTYYLHKKIENFIKKRPSKANIKILLEDSPLGTAGSISLISEEDRDFLMVVNGDVISDINFETMALFHSEKLNDITITVSQYSQKIPFGVIDLDKRLNFKNLKEKPVFNYYILSGIYCMNRKVCDLVKNEYLDMTALIEKAHLLDNKIGIFPIHEFWKDVGNLEDFNQVDKKEK